VSDLVIALLAVILVVGLVLAYQLWFTADRRDARRGAAILETLADYSAGLTGHELHAATGLRSEMFYSILGRLERERLIRSWLQPLKTPGDLRRRLYGLPKQGAAR
jgi:hypothetical protein